VLGVALSTALLLGILGLHAGYVRSLDATIDRMGYQVLVTAKGCPYEAASLVMRGGNVPMYIDDAVFDGIVADPDVAEATRIFMQGLEAGEADRLTVFVGVDDRFRRLKPWMSLQRGDWFSGDAAPEAVLGFNAAVTLGLNLGDRLPVGPAHEPVTIRGVFDRTGTQDDGMVYLPLRFAQQLFDRQGKLTAVGVRLRSLDRVEAFLGRVFEIPSVQAITLTQFRATVLEFVATSRLLLILSALIAGVVGGLGVLNAMLMSVTERTRELALMKAVGASASDLFRLTLLETACLGLIGAVTGLAVSLATGWGLDPLVRALLPFAPPGPLLIFTPSLVTGSILAALILSVLAGVYPAARAAYVRPARALRRAA
jgi:putative ABC transport system permease protein